FLPEQHFFKPYGGWFRRQLKKFTHIFVQNQSSLDLLLKAGITQAGLSGDTRFDRVAAIAERPADFPHLKAFSEGHKILVAGSTWPADEELLLPLIQDGGIDLKYIVAPHEIHSDQIADLKNKIGDQVEIFSEIGEEVRPDTRVLIIDRIGLLSGLYRLGSLAYIGGGFGRGIHNILEAVTFGLPVFFGPRYESFAEAVELQQRGGAFPVRDASQLLEGVAGFLKEPAKLQDVSQICLKYIEEKKGASGIIIDHLKKILS
ncbi:MAG: 3-deoxy-D-manno-octulosonic acid transferase, partial [Bacteroides sp.]|nr:3-deoxy-D-manno-octulosonic acid transferase [Bacteroides sp.]